MKTTMLVLDLVLIFSLLSCIEGTIVSPEKNSNAIIKRKSFYNYVEDKIPYKTYEYLYDDEGKLQKIYHYLGNHSSKAYEYELYRYTCDNKIINRITYSYANDSSGWILYDSTYYSYYNGRLKGEETFYFTVSLDRVAYKYEYENSHLIRKFKYYNHQLESCTMYDYSGGFCIKETMFSDSLGIDTMEYIIHQYENGILIKSERFIGNGRKIQIITYTYNDKGNVIIEEAKQTDFTIVKPMYYVIRYEYY
ncbi:MAG: hypothetical protein AB1432_05755 [Bacteroidota bacterium]